MAKIQSKKININDFSLDSRPDVAKLARSLNPFFDDVERAFRKGLTVEDNLPFQYVTFTVTVDLSGVPLSSTIISTNLTNVRGMCIIDAVASDGVSHPTGAPFVSKTISNNIIRIDHVAGLPSSKQFTLTALILS